MSVFFYMNECAPGSDTMFESALVCSKIWRIMQKQDAGVDGSNPTFYNAGVKCACVFGRLFFVTFLDCTITFILIFCKSLFYIF